jgi:hypothetical protein
MSGSFDGYHVWLGIPPSEQPPNHYRLLGIAVFEADLDVIDHAADRQMAHVRTFQAGKNGAVSQQILNELAVARVCLLNTGKKAAYDEALRGKLQAVPKAVPVSPSAAIPQAAPVETSLLRPEPAANTTSKVRGAAAAVAPLYEPEEELDDDLNDDNFGLPPAGLTSTGSIQLRARRRRLIRLPAWATSAGMGITAGLIVVTVLVLYYVGRQLMKPAEWQQFLIHGPVSSETELPPATEAEVGAATPPPPMQ